MGKKITAKQTIIENQAERPNISKMLTNPNV